jgi:hypothetical protein
MTQKTYRCNLNILFFIALIVIVYSAYLAITYARQLPLDLHAFRQSQTALTAFWFIHDGIKFAYQTPVGGFPWSIPFEFPIYQAIVAYISKYFNLNLDATGRIASYCFLLISIIPIRSITKKLELSQATIFYFVAILFSMPIYIYWGRSFMIETAALFFGVAAIKYFVDYLQGNRSIYVKVAFVFFSTLCVLQKATTALPILAVLAIIFFAVEVKKGSFHKKLFCGNIFLACILFFIPILIGFAWVIFTDQVKMQNQLGHQLTSTAISKHNWGSFFQRISSDLWVKVVWERILSGNAGGLLGIFLLGLPFLTRQNLKIRLISLSVLALFFAPIFIFTNLHIVHDYYQSANVIFLAYGMALALSLVVSTSLGNTSAIFLLILVLVSNYSSLYSGYLPQMKNIFTKENRDLAVGKILNSELAPNMQFIAYGNDWSSSLAYISERKSFTVPAWFERYDRVISNPEEFLEKGLLGAVVACRVESPSITQIFDWSKNNGSWKVGETHGCVIATPEAGAMNHFSGTAECRGAIDRAVVEKRDGKEYIIISGWARFAEESSGSLSNALLKVSHGSATPMYFQALSIPKIDVDKPLKIQDDPNYGFSRILQNNFMPGNYDVEIMLKSADQYKSCGIHKKISIQ